MDIRRNSIARIRSFDHGDESGIGLERMHTVAADAQRTERREITKSGSDLEDDVIDKGIDQQIAYKKYQMLLEMART